MPFKNPPPLYTTWASMHDRCRNANASQWPNYGGRGIAVCARWRSFKAFVEDMGPKPPYTTLDRIDNDGNYEPSNCRWADKWTQRRNQRDALYVTIGSNRYRALDLATLAGVKTDTIVARVARGLSYDAVVSPQRSLNKNGLTLGGLANGARQKARTHCKRGHEFTPANTYVSKTGARQCRQCHNAKMRRRFAQRAAPTRV